MSNILPKIKTYNEDTKESQKVLEIIDTLYHNTDTTDENLLFLLNHISQKEAPYLYQKAVEARTPFYQNKVYLRALIEVSNYCKRGCYYCGINRDNKEVHRYRMSKEDIIETVKEAYLLGYRTFVLQSGEDPFFTDDILVPIIQEIKENFPDTRITLSLGERTKESYQKLFLAGADRYLLRHETANKELYEFLHPQDSSFLNRMNCLKEIKEVGFQVGAGFMVNSPNQTNHDIVKDLRFLREFEPHMIGIGPFIPHHTSIFKDKEAGEYEQTVALLAIVRLLLPKVLLPATTALGTVKNFGRELALNAGANVIMPNVSPEQQRKFYQIYENKLCARSNNYDTLQELKQSILNHNHIADLGIGDYFDLEEDSRQ